MLNFDDVYPMLCRVARYVARSKLWNVDSADIEDITADVLCNLVRHWDQMGVQDEEACRKWVVVATCNRCADHMRRVMQKPLVLVPDVSVFDRAQDDPTDDPRREWVLKRLDKLAYAQREAVEHAFEDRDHAPPAERQALFRAVRNLRCWLETARGKPDLSNLPLSRG